MTEDMDIVSKYLTLMRNPVRKPLKGRRRSRTLIEMHEIKSKSTHFQQTGELQKGADKNNDKQNTQHTYLEQKENNAKLHNIYSSSYLKGSQSSDHKQSNNITEASKKLCKNPSNIFIKNSLKRVSKKTSFRESNRKYLLALVSKYSNAPQKANKNLATNIQESKSKTNTSDINKCGHSTEHRSPKIPTSVNNPLRKAKSEKMPTGQVLPESNLNEKKCVNNSLWPPVFNETLTKCAKQKRRVKTRLKRECAPLIESDFISKSLPPSPFDETLPEPTNTAPLATKNECVSLIESDHVNNSLPPSLFDETLLPNPALKKTYTSLAKDSGPSSETDYTGTSLTSLDLKILDDTLPKNTLPKKTMQKSSSSTLTSCANVSIPPLSQMVDDTVPRTSVQETGAQESVGSISFLSTYALHLYDNTLPKNTMPKKRATSLTRQGHVKAKDKATYCSDPDSLPKNDMPPRKSFSSTEIKPLKYTCNCPPTTEILKKTSMSLIKKVKVTLDHEIPYYKIHEELPLNHIPKKGTISKNVKNAQECNVIGPLTKKQELNSNLNKNVVHTTSNKQKIEACNYIQNMLKKSDGISHTVDKTRYSDPESYPKNVICKDTKGKSTHAKMTHKNSLKEDMLQKKRGKVTKPPERPFTAPLYRNLPKNDIPRNSMTKKIISKSTEKLRKKYSDGLHFKDTKLTKTSKEGLIQSCVKQLSKESPHRNEGDKLSLAQDVSKYTKQKARSATNVLKASRPLELKALSHKPIKILVVENENGKASIKHTLNKNKTQLNKLGQLGASKGLTTCQEIHKKHEKTQPPLSAEKLSNLSKEHFKNEQRKVQMSYEKIVDTKSIVQKKEPKEKVPTEFSDIEVVACQHNQEESEQTISEELARIKQSTFAEDLHKVLSKSSGEILRLSRIQYNQGRKKEASALEEQLKCENDERLQGKPITNTEEKSIITKKTTEQDKLCHKFLLKNPPQKRQKLSQLQNVLKYESPKYYKNLKEENLTISLPKKMKSSSSFHKSKTMDNKRKLRPPSSSRERQVTQRAARESCRADVKTPAIKQSFLALRNQKTANIKARTSKDKIHKNKLQVKTSHSRESLRKQTEKKQTNIPAVKNAPPKKTVTKPSSNDILKSKHQSIQRNIKVRSQDLQTKHKVAEKIYKKVQGNFLTSYNNPIVEDKDASSKLIEELQKSKKGLLARGNNNESETEFNKKETDQNINNAPLYTDAAKQHADLGASTHDRVSYVSQETVNRDPSLNFFNQSTKYLNVPNVKPPNNRVGSARSISPRKSLQNETAQQKQPELNTHKKPRKVTSEEFVQLPGYRNNHKFSQINLPLQEISENIRPTEQQKSNSPLPKIEIKELSNKLSYNCKEQDDIDDYCNYNKKLLKFIPQEVIEQSLKSPHKPPTPTLILPPRRSDHKAKNYSLTNRKVDKQKGSTIKQQSKKVNKSRLKVDITEHLALPNSYIYQQVKLTRTRINERKSAIENEDINNLNQNLSQISKRPSNRPTGSIQSPRLEEKPRSPTHKVSIHDWSKSDKNDTKNIKKDKPDGSVATRTQTQHGETINQCHKTDTSKSKVDNEGFETAAEVSDKIPNSMRMDQKNNSTHTSQSNTTSHSHGIQEPNTSFISTTPSSSNIGKDMIKDTTTKPVVERAVSNKTSETGIPKPFRLEDDDEFELKLQQIPSHPQIRYLPESKWLDEKNLDKITENTTNITSGQTHPRLVSLEQTHKGKSRQDVLAVRKAYRNSHLKADLPEVVQNQEPGTTLEKGEFAKGKTTPPPSRPTPNEVKTTNTAEKTDKLNKGTVIVPDNNTATTLKYTSATSGDNTTVGNTTEQSLKMGNISEQRTNVTAETYKTADNENNLKIAENILVTKAKSTTTIQYNSTTADNTTVSTKNAIGITGKNTTPQHQTEFLSNQVVTTNKTRTPIKTRLPVSTSPSIYKDIHLKSKTKASVDKTIKKAWSAADKVQEKTAKPIKIKQHVDNVTTSGKMTSMDKTRLPIYTPNIPSGKTPGIETPPKTEKSTAIEDKNSSMFEITPQVHKTEPLKAEHITVSSTSNSQTPIREKEKGAFLSDNRADLVKGTTATSHERTLSEMRKTENATNLHNATTVNSKVETGQLSTMQDKTNDKVIENKTSGGANILTTQEDKNALTKGSKTLVHSSKTPYRLDDDDEFELQYNERDFHLRMKPALEASWLNAEDFSNITETTMTVPEGQTHPRNIAFKLPPHPEIKPLRASAWLKRSEINEITEKTGFSRVLQDQAHSKPGNKTQSVNVSKPEQTSSPETNISSLHTKTFLTGSTEKQDTIVVNQQQPGKQHIHQEALTGKPTAATHSKYDDASMTKRHSMSDNTNEDVLKIPCIDEPHINKTSGVTTKTTRQSKAIVIQPTEKSTKYNSSKKEGSKPRKEPFRSHIDKQELRKLIENEFKRLKKSNELVQPPQLEREPTIEVIHTNHNIPDLPDVDSLLQEPWPSKQPKINTDKSPTGDTNKLSQKTETTNTNEGNMNNRTVSSTLETPLQCPSTKIHDSNIKIPQQIIDKIPVQGRDESIKADNNVMSKQPVNPTQENIPITIVPLEGDTNNEMKKANKELTVHVSKQIAQKTFNDEIKCSQPLSAPETLNSTQQSKENAETQQKELNKTTNIQSHNNINTQTEKTMYTKVVSTHETGGTKTVSSPTEKLRANTTLQTHENTGKPEKTFKSRKWCTMNPNVETENNHPNNKVLQYTEDKEGSKTRNKPHIMNPAGETTFNNASQVHQNAPADKASYTVQKPKIKDTLQKTPLQKEIKTYMKDLQQGNFEQGRLKTSEQQLQINTENEIKKPLHTSTTNNSIHKKVTHEIQAFKQADTSTSRCNQIKYPVRLRTHSSENRESIQSSNKPGERPSTSSGERAPSSVGKGAEHVSPLPPPAAAAGGSNSNKAKEGDYTDQSKNAAKQGPKSKTRDTETPVCGLGKHFNSTTIRGRANAKIQDKISPQTLWRNVFVREANPFHDDVYRPQATLNRHSYSNSTNYIYYKHFTSRKNSINYYSWTN